MKHLMHSYSNTFWSPSCCQCSNLKLLWQCILILYLYCR